MGKAAYLDIETIPSFRQTAKNQSDVAYHLGVVLPDGKVKSTLLDTPLVRGALGQHVPPVRGEGILSTVERIPPAPGTGGREAFSYAKTARLLQEQTNLSRSAKDFSLEALLNLRKDSPVMFYYGEHELRTAVETSLSRGSITQDAVDRILPSYFDGSKTQYMAVPERAVETRVLREQAIGAYSLDPTEDHLQRARKATVTHAERTIESLQKGEFGDVFDLTKGALARLEELGHLKTKGVFNSSLETLSQALFDIPEYHTGDYDAVLTKHIGDWASGILDPNADPSAPAVNAHMKAFASKLTKVREKEETQKMFNLYVNNTEGTRIYGTRRLGTLTIYGDQEVPSSFLGNDPTKGITKSQLKTLDVDGLSQKLEPYMQGKFAPLGEGSARNVAEGLASRIAAYEAPSPLEGIKGSVKNILQQTPLESMLVGGMVLGGVGVAAMMITQGIHAPADISGINRSNNELGNDFGSRRDLFNAASMSVISDMWESGRGVVTGIMGTLDIPTLNPITQTSAPHLIVEALRDYDTPLATEWGRASQFGLAAKYQEGAISSDEQDEMDASGILNTSTGTRIHAEVQAQLARLHPGIHSEYVIRDPNTKLTGHVDLVVPMQTEYGVVDTPVEIKTISGRGLSSLSAPKEGHVAQAQFYLHYLAEKAYEQNKPTPEYEQFIYVSRDDPSKFKTFKVKRSEQSFRYYLARYRRYQDEIQDRGDNIRRMSSHSKSAIEDAMAGISNMFNSPALAPPSQAQFDVLAAEAIGRQYGINRSSKSNLDFDSPAKAIWARPSRKIAESGGERIKSVNVSPIPVVKSQSPSTLMNPRKTNNKYGPYIRPRGNYLSRTERTQSRTAGITV